MYLILVTVPSQGPTTATNKVLHPLLPLLICTWVLQLLRGRKLEKLQWGQGQAGGDRARTRQSIRDDELSKLLVFGRKGRLASPYQMAMGHFLAEMEPWDSLRTSWAG